MNEILDKLDRLAEVMEDRGKDLGSKKIAYEAKYDRGYYSGAAWASRWDADMVREVRKQIAADLEVAA